EVNKCRPEVRALGPGYAHIEALQAALEPLDLIPERNHDYYPNRLLKLSMSDYLAARHDAGIYRADISFDVYQYQRLACLPLRAGQEFATARARIGIASVLAETEGCTVIIREQYINPLFMRNRDPMPGSRFLYLLVNSETKEAFLPERNHQNAMRGDHASFVVMNKPLQFSSSNKATYSIDETWLENAELVIVEAQWIGEAHHDLEDLTFRLEKSPPAPKVIPDTSAKDNLEKLAAIHLPENPNRNEVRSYIKEIHSISATQESFSGKDPQIGMLLQIDPEHLDLLIQTVLDSDPNYYERRALRVLAQPEHKDLVLRYLFQVPVLASAVNHYGWQEDAREILLEGLREKETLPEDWLVAVIRLNDPTTYSLLADFFVRGDSFRAKTYGAIHDLPGIELEDAVSKAWEKAQIGSPAQRCDMIPIALAHGHYNALAAAVMSLSKSSMDEPRKARFRESIQAHTGITGSDEGLRAWFDVNKDRLRFDPETKLFVSATEPVRTVLLPDDAVIEGTIRNLRTDGVIGYWNRPEDHIRFNIPELDMGTYRITAKYAAPAGYGGKVSFRLNDTKLEKKFSPTGGWRVSGEATVGDFEHLGGSLDITLTMLEQNGTNLVVIDLYSLTLEKKQPEGTRE
ncbi:MAG: hypothetical protein K9L89_05925, partial [Kiritimatiellales bacterium]|nr:hypothetical protein [Kiritimatiellales bacterium]